MERFPSCCMSLVTLLWYLLDLFRMTLDVEATVLLAANVGFLAIPSVDNGPHISPAQIASLLSLIPSLGSIFTGLLLVRHHRTKGIEAAKEAVCSRLSACIHAFSTFRLMPIPRRSFSTTVPIRDSPWRSLRSYTVYRTLCSCGGAFLSHFT